MDSPTNIAMNRIVCHAGAMREGIGGGEGRFASGLTVSKTARWEVKLRYPVALLMIWSIRAGERSILHSRLSGLTLDYRFPGPSGAPAGLANFATSTATFSFISFA